MNSGQQGSSSGRNQGAAAQAAAASSEPGPSHTHPTSDASVQYHFVPVPQVLEGRDRIEYQLTIREQPKQSRMCGSGEKADRRPVDPAPIIQLKVITHDMPRPGGTTGVPPHATVAAANLPAGLAIPRRNNAMPLATHDIRSGVPVTTAWGPGWEDKAWYLENPYYFMYAMLADAETDAELLVMSDGRTRSTTGSCVSCLYHLKDVTDNSDQGFFVFPDLSIRAEGRYRLKLSLFETIGNEVHHCKSIYTHPFQVHSAKGFPGMNESTQLARSFASQGLKLRVRKNPRSKRRANAGQNYDSDDDGQDETESSSRQTKRMRSDSQQTTGAHSTSQTQYPAPAGPSSAQYRGPSGHGQDVHRGGDHQPGHYQHPHPDHHHPQQYQHAYSHPSTPVGPEQQESWGRSPASGQVPHQQQQQQHYQHAQQWKGKGPEIESPHHQQQQQYQQYHAPPPQGSGPPPGSHHPHQQHQGQGPYQREVHSPPSSRTHPAAHNQAGYYSSPPVGSGGPQARPSSGSHPPPQGTSGYYHSPYPQGGGPPSGGRTMPSSPYLDPRLAESGAGGTGPGQGHHNMPSPAALAGGGPPAFSGSTGGVRSSHMTTGSNRDRSNSAAATLLPMYMGGGGGAVGSVYGDRVRAPSGPAAMGGGGAGGDANRRPTLPPIRSLTQGGGGNSGVATPGGGGNQGGMPRGGGLPSISRPPGASQSGTQTPTYGMSGMEGPGSMSAPGSAHSYYPPSSPEAGRPSTQGGYFGSGPGGFSTSTGRHGPGASGSGGGLMIPPYAMGSSRPSSSSGGMSSIRTDMKPPPLLPSQSSPNRERERERLASREFAGVGSGFGQQGPPSSAQAQQSQGYYYQQQHQQHSPPSHHGPQHGHSYAPPPPSSSSSHHHHHSSHHSHSHSHSQASVASSMTTVGTNTGTMSGTVSPRGPAPAAMLTPTASISPATGHGWQGQQQQQAQIMEEERRRRAGGSAGGRRGSGGEGDRYPHQQGDRDRERSSRRR